MPRRGNELVVIFWRDIPAQVNARAGAEKHQVILPRRFQRAIDDAAMVAGKKTANEYVGEWRRTSLPLPRRRRRDPGRGRSRSAAPRRRVPRERLQRFVANGGWDPDATEPDRDRARVVTATVVFTPSGQRGHGRRSARPCSTRRAGSASISTRCATAARSAGAAWSRPRSGSFAKHAIASEPDHLGGPTVAERGVPRPARARRRPTGSRARRTSRGDVVIDVPAASQVHRPVVRKTVALDDLVIDPVVRLYLVDVPAADLGADRSDLRRLLRRARRAVGPDRSRRPARACSPRCNPRSRRGARTVTVAVHDGHSVTAVWPGFVDTAYGVAIDVGSTTVAGHLCDLATGEVVASAGIMNPQIRFGEDLMSRVSYVMMHDDGAARAHRHDPRRPARRGRRSSSRTAGDRPRARRSTSCSSAIRSCITSCSASIPTPLGTAPFTLATDEPVDAWADDIELDLPDAHLHLLPCIAGHVGADTAAAVLQEGPHRGDDIMLLVDVGTNAEIVLGNREWLFAASSPTGPRSKARSCRRASARRPARSSGCASTARRSSRASR